MEQLTVGQPATARMDGGDRGVVLLLRRTRELMHHSVRHFPSVHLIRPDLMAGR